MSKLAELNLALIDTLDTNELLLLASQFRAMIRYTELTWLVRTQAKKGDNTTTAMRIISEARDVAISQIPSEWRS